MLPVLLLTVEGHSLIFMEALELKDLLATALEDFRANNVVSLDVRELTDIMDYLIVAGGTSSRHVKALADNLTEAAKQHGVRPQGVEGQAGSEWILVDFGDVVAHLMLPAAREFYDLERLWTGPATKR